MKIRTKMIAALTLVVLVLGCVSSYMWYYSSINTVSRYLQDYSYSVMQNAYGSIKAVTDNVNYTEIMIANNRSNMISPLKANIEYGNDKAYDHERLQNDRKIDEFISSVYGYKDYLTGICVFPRDYQGKYYKIGETPAQPDQLFRQIEQIGRERMEKGSVLMAPGPANQNYSTSLTYLVPMVNMITDSSGNLYGYIAVMFDYKSLDKIVENSLPVNSKLQLVDDSAQLIYSNCGDKIIQRPREDLFQLMRDKVVYNEIEFEQNGWICKMQITADNLVGDINKTFINMLIVYMVIFMLGICLVVYISYRLTKNITILNDSMQKIAAGNLDIQIAIRSEDETGRMGEVFNDMVRQLNQLISEVKESEEHKRIAEIDFLQAQINPHFLSNVLNTVIWLADMKNETNISQLTKALVDLLHSAMRRGEIITVEDELKYIQSYVEIEQYTFVDNFEISYDIEPGTEQLYMPRFLLQPIVENALIHSLRELTDRLGELKITVKREGQKLVIITHDNGKGMTDQEIEGALHREPDREKQKFSSIGIYNVAERIRLMYGEEYGLTYQSEIDQYTDVTIILPIIEDADEGRG